MEEGRSLDCNMLQLEGDRFPHDRWVDGRLSSKTPSSLTDETQTDCLLHLVLPLFLGLVKRNIKIRYTSSSTIWIGPFVPTFPGTIWLSLLASVNANRT